MIEKKDVVSGFECFWMGGTKVSVYGQRKVPAKIILITESGRIQIEIETPNGKVKKFVSANSLEYKNKP